MTTPAPQIHGGLSPGAMRRVREYVAAHLSESTDLAMLAAVAGLSMHHFARGFKQSAGITPHHYLTQKRVERAQDMLANTDSYCRRLPMPWVFPTKAIWHVISARCLALRPDSFDGRSARLAEAFRQQ
jgi:AraC-like DNA-binding protein